MCVCVCIYGDGNTRIDVLWPAAISCQTVLTAPINDPNPPFMDIFGFDFVVFHLVRSENT